VNRMWPLRRQLAAGMAFSLVLLAVLGGTAFVGARDLVDTNARLSQARRTALEIERIRGRLRAAEASQRAFLITEQSEFLTPHDEDLRLIDEGYRALRREAAGDPEQERRIERLRPLLRERTEQLADVVELRRRGGIAAAARSLIEGSGRRTVDSIMASLEEIGAAADERADLLELDVSTLERRVFGVLLGGTLAALLLVIAAFVSVMRGMSRTIDVAVQRMQSSSAELQAAATQQVQGAKDQATASDEVSSTIHELLATSRQIAERARKVTDVADQTAHAARTGDGSMRKADDAISAILHQIERIVSHMLALVRKSQEIGGILDIINDLAEETNILAINATVEAAGAGESGRRFSVVASEIRKLSDRTGASAREIRALIEEIRTAANTTVMATESGSKAANVGAAEFRAVAKNFRRIVDLVGSTADVAREIELSTKQQASAVEQVNTAIGEVADRARQSEASSSQTLSASSEIADLSRELTSLIQRASRT
jgi:methyl-accepting chemotaxis protein